MKNPFFHKVNFFLLYCTSFPYSTIYLMIFSFKIFSVTYEAIIYEIKDIKLHFIDIKCYIFWLWKFVNETSLL